MSKNHDHSGKNIGPVPPTPKPVDTPPTVISKDVRVATPDIILFDDSAVPIDVMTDLIFEDIGGQELINLSRNDLVGGQNVIYHPVKNLSNIFLQYNPQNILQTQDTANVLFNNYTIKLEDRLLTDQDLVAYNNDILKIYDKAQYITSPVYLDPTTGDLVVLLSNLSNDEQVEIQLLSNGTEFNDILYGVE